MLVCFVCKVAISKNVKELFEHCRHSHGVWAHNDVMFAVKTVAGFSRINMRSVISSTPACAQDTSILENETLLECKYADDKDLLISLSILLHNTK
jgi:hypothetical protein